LNRIETQHFSILSDEDVLGPFFSSQLPKNLLTILMQYWWQARASFKDNAVLAVSLDYLGSDEFLPRHNRSLR
jgi:hypothetical protein